MKEPCVYILTNATRTVLYTGVTSNLRNRMAQHASGNGSIFTRKYRVHTLVYAEFFPRMNDAIAMEKRIKSWPRKKKIELIEEQNPEWHDLFKGMG